MKKGLILISAILLVLSSCTKFDLPTVSAPETETVEISNSVELTFSYTTDAGFASSSVIATNGTASIVTDGAVNANSGSIVVTFIAGTSEGTGSVTIRVKDAEGAEASATAEINIV